MKNNNKDQKREAQEAKNLDANLGANLDTAAFLKVADKFIDVANRENKSTPATDLHMAFLFAAARYNAYVANAIMKVDNHEEYVAHMVKQYTEMLRQHLADSDIVKHIN